MNSDSATAAVAPDAQIASLERAAAEAAAGDKRKGEEPVHEGENQELNSQHPNQNVDSCTSELALKRAKVDGSEGEEFKKEARRPKRKVALLMSYCGTGYQGMQINRDAKTIELDLFRALAAAGAISKDNSTDLKKNAFQRAARTDKGVHAAGQVVSLKMIIEDPNIITKINSQLIDQIRVWGYVRTVGSFNSKNSCDSRVYEYLLPTFVFYPTAEEKERLARTRATPMCGRILVSSSDEVIAEKRKTQITPPVLERVREALKQYEGTHDYMNFTVTRGCNEKNSKRYIHYFTASDPILINGTEWLSLKVKGQSFMLHQIRKMVGLVVLMIRFNTPVRVIGEIFKSPRINIPKAPSLGLLLEQPMFDAYNRHVTTKKHMSQNTEPIKFEPYREAIEKFKQDFIYNEIFGREFETNVFDKWVQWCELFPDQYSYLNDEGVVPESAYVSNQTNKEISNFLANLKAASGIDSQRDDRDDPQSDINE